MHKTTTAILVATGLLAGGLWVASAQSLADIAHKEEERRKETKAGKTYTNKDLRAVPPSSTPPPPTATAIAGAVVHGHARSPRPPSPARRRTRRIGPAG